MKLFYLLIISILLFGDSKLEVLKFWIHSILRTFYYWAKWILVKKKGKKNGTHN